VWWWWGGGGVGRPGAGVVGGWWWVVGGKGGGVVVGGGGGVWGVVVPWLKCFVVLTSIEPHCTRCARHRFENGVGGRIPCRSNGAAVQRVVQAFGYVGVALPAGKPNRTAG